MASLRKFSRWLLRWEWLVLLLLIPITLLPWGWTTLALALIPLFWIVRKVATGRFVTPTPYDLAVALLVLMLGVSLTVTYDLSVSGPKIAGIFLGIALLYGTVGFGRQGRSLWPVVAFVLLSGALMGVIGLVGASWLPPFDFLNRARALVPWPGGIPGAVNGVVNPNELAGVLCLVLPLQLACLLACLRGRWPGRVALAVLLGLAMLGSSFLLVATLSRGGILAATLGLLLVVACHVSARWRLVLTIGVLVGLIALVAYTGSRADQNFVGDAVGMTGRLEIWSRALLGIADFPLTGMGVNGFRHVVDVLYPLYSVPADIDLGHAHNQLLQAALDLGLPGLVAYLALWFVSAGLLWSAYARLRQRHATYHSYFGLVAGLAGALLAGWLFGVFDAIALGARPGFLWWLLLGLTAAVHYAVVHSGEPLRRRRRSRAVASQAAPGAASSVIP